MADQVLIPYTRRITMAIQNLLSGFEVSLLTFVFGAALAILLRKKLSRPIPKKSPTIETQK
jgi:hypothetical protein